VFEATGIHPLETSYKMSALFFRAKGIMQVALQKYVGTAYELTKISTLFDGKVLCPQSTNPHSKAAHYKHVLFDCGAGFSECSCPSSRYSTNFAAFASF